MEAKRVVVCALAAPPRRQNFVNGLFHKNAVSSTEPLVLYEGKKRIVANEKKPEGTRRYTLTINQGQDIREKVLNYFQDCNNSSGSSNGRKRMGVILNATGSVLHPKMDAENSATADKSSYEIKNIEGRFIMWKDGQVQQHELWFISCVGASGLLIRDEVNGRLVAAEPVQVVVGTFPL